MTEAQQREVYEVRPWDLIRPGVPKAPRWLAEERYGKCVACPQFQNATKTCAICHCFMKLKTHLAEAHCPEGRWGTYTERTDA
jgi:hypothetical protein